MGRRAVGLGVLLNHPPSGCPGVWCCYECGFLCRLCCVHARWVLQFSETLKAPIHLTVTKASKSAISAVEALGGTVVCQYDTALSLRATLKPEKFDVLPKRPSPPPKAMPYYLDDDNRGYLSHHVQLTAAQKRLADAK